jgi:NAD(P)-dependent dehydrogenase (short-subunit alcohol dehydrogenase family)
MGLIAFSKTLAWEGAKYNIHSTAIAPVSPFVDHSMCSQLMLHRQIAASAMTEGLMPAEIFAKFKVRICR